MQSSCVFFSSEYLCQKICRRAKRKHAKCQKSDASREVSLSFRSALRMRCFNLFNEPKNKTEKQLLFPSRCTFSIIKNVSCGEKKLRRTTSTKNVDLLFNELRTINFHNSKQCAERRLVFIRKIWIEDEKKVERRGDLHKTNAFSKDLPTSVNLSEMSVPFFP